MGARATKTSSTARLRSRARSTLAFTNCVATLPLPRCHRRQAASLNRRLRPRRACSATPLVPLLRRGADPSTLSLHLGNPPVAVIPFVYGLQLVFGALPSCILALATALVRLQEGVDRVVSELAVVALDSATCHDEQSRQLLDLVLVERLLPDLEVSRGIEINVAVIIGRERLEQGCDAA